jgi:hypothetical protein
MVFAADYPFLDVVWSMFVFFAFVIWIWILITVLSDVFRRRDMSGWGKAAWTVFLIVLPYLGVLTYLIAYHDGMADRNVERARAAQAEFDNYVKTVAKPSDSGGPAAEIETAKSLLDSGSIDQSEFDAIKTRALAHS